MHQFHPMPQLQPLQRTCGYPRQHVGTSSHSMVSYAAGRSWMPTYQPVASTTVYLAGECPGDTLYP
jgi:hypothetical protein